MTHQLFEALTAVGAGWVMYLLIGLSVLSVALMLERLVYFVRFSSARTASLTAMLSHGRFEEARNELGLASTFEGAVVRAAIDAAPGGPAAVDEVVACAIAHERPGFERFLSFFGTLGNNAPFLGLFGTVIGIIKA
ncbi:MAG: MotA/TolQ/ExbB proton channel family protein, partial [Deltaproteobacteria bacterium]|nr:MotA/TolQ/ExbB proton channel family protein [Deltaproteobacteria bacterium]